MIEINELDMGEYFFIDENSDVKICIPNCNNIHEAKRRLRKFITDIRQNKVKLP